MVGRKIYRALRNNLNIQDQWSVYMILFCIFVFYICTRMWMWFQYGMAGFGYDTGIYRYIVTGYFLNSGNIPFGFSAYSNWLMILGTDVDVILLHCYIAIACAIFYAIYRMGHVYFGRIYHGIFIVFLFAVSITQYEFFWWYYYRQFLSLLFIIIAFLFIHYRSYFLIPVLVAIGIIHPLSLIPLGLSLIIYMFIATRDMRRYIFISGLISVIVLCISNWQELMMYAQDFFHYHGVAKNFVVAGYQEFTGQFIGWKDWLQYSVWYIPFAIMGIWKYFKKQPLLFIFSCVSIGLIMVQIVFYRRFFVFLDMVVIMYAGAFLADICLTVMYMKYKYIIYILIIVYSIIGIGYITYTLANKKPLLSRIEISKIQSVSSLVSDSDFVLSIDSMYAPWLRGFSDKKIIAPGLFEYNKWNREEWQIFWFSSDIDMKIEMLRMYDVSPLYIYTGDSLFNLGPYGNFVRPFLIRVDL